MTDVPPHTLRFWEKSLGPILEPFRTPGGQRRYDESHLLAIREVRRRVMEEHQSLAAIRHEMLRERDSGSNGSALERRLLADPDVQRAVEGVAEAVRRRVREILHEAATGTVVGKGPLP